MFGALRLVLALLVAAGHVGLPHQVNLAGSAVVVFFLLSGFVMTALVERHYPVARLYPAFLCDRALRLFPQYLFWLGVLLVWLIVVERQVQAFQPRAILENIALVPSMFAAVFDWRPWLTGVLYISQTWSLSLEAYFYLLLPFLLFWRYGRIVGYVTSYVVFSLALLNLLNPSDWGYHLLPGVLLIFLTGSFIYQDRRDVAVTPRRTLTSLVAVLVAAGIANTAQTLDHHWSPEVLMGFFAGVPLVYFLAGLPAQRQDTSAGDFSYGVFLNHNVVLAMNDRYGWATGGWTRMLLVLAGSVALAAVSYHLVERPFERLRRRRRKSLPEPDARVASDQAALASAVPSSRSQM